MAYWRNSSFLAMLLLMGLLYVQTNSSELTPTISLSDKCFFNANDFEFSPTALKPVVSFDNLVRVPFIVVTLGDRHELLPQSGQARSGVVVTGWRAKVYVNLILSLGVLRI